MSAAPLHLTVAQWDHARWLAALRRVPALVLILGLAIAYHQLAAGIVAAGACLTVGLLGTRQVAGSRVWAMAGTCLAMAFSAGVGTLVGDSHWLNPVVTTVWALLFAFFTIHDEDSGWIAMQGVIALVIAMTFPSHGHAALLRALVVLMGGALQIASLTLFAGLRRLILTGRNPSWTATPEPDTDYRWRDFLVSFTLFSAAWQYALRVALTLLIATEAARHLAIQNGYWLPMTTIIILKPDFYRTYSGAIQRVAGTFVGVALASLIAHFFHPSAGSLIVLVAFFSFGCFALLAVNPILFTAALTAYVIFLIAIGGLPEAAVTGHRLVLTALGSGLALASRFVGYRHLLRLLGGRRGHEDA